jgi:hypothetical protein
LYGGGPGGAAATKRKRDIAALQKAVADIAQHVEELSRGGKQNRPRQKQRRPQKRSPRAEEAPSRSDGQLWRKLCEAFAVAQKQQTPPTDGEVTSFLNKLLQLPSQNSQQTSSTRQPNQPSQQSQQQQQPPSAASDAEPRSFAAIAKAAQRTPQQMPARLWKGLWNAEIIAASAVEKHDLKTPVVVACHSSQQVANTRTWLSARGNSASATLVHIRADGATDSVLLHGDLGPVRVPANIEYVGPSAPKKKALPASVKDDDPSAGEEAMRDKTTTCRVTFVKEFADAELFARCTKHPQCLPTLVLGPTAAKEVLQTRAAIAYDKEVTCLVKVRTAAVPELLKLRLPVGAFVAQHASQSRPQWIRRPAEQSSGEYWKRATAQRDKGGGSLIYRSTNRSSIGVLNATAALEDTEVPRWFLSGAPGHWTEADAQAWAIARGFSQPEGWQRRGRSSWIFRAQVPEGATDANATFTFASGITVGPALGTRRAPSRQSATAPKTVWGTRPPPAAQQSDDVVMLEAPVQQTPAQPAQAANQQAPAQQSTATRPAVESDAKRQRLDAFKGSSPPFGDDFEAVECGGEGDCAYCSIARGLADQNRKSSTAIAGEDFAPKGRAQAQLRVLASRELQKHGSEYGDVPPGFAAEVGTAGKWADSRSLHALASAANVELRIWAYDSKLQRWDLYVVGPREKKKQSPQIVWLRLQAQHYQLLRPRATGPSPERQREWLQRAVYKPQDLSGAGRSLDADVLSCMGIAAPSSAAQSSRAAPKAAAGSGRKRLRSVSSSVVPAPSAHQQRPSASAGRGAPGSSAKSLLSKMGIKRVASSTVVMRRPAAATVATQAASLDDVAVPAMREIGQQLFCPCGWKPCQTGPANSRRQEAVVHWRQCQGKKPPLVPRSELGAVVHKNALAAGRSNAELSRSRFLSFRDEFYAKHPHMAGALCEPILENPLPRFDAAGQAWYRYQCKKCSGERLLSELRRHPCMSRPAFVKVVAFKAAVTGKPEAEIRQKENLDKVKERLAAKKRKASS